MLALTTLKGRALASIIHAFWFPAKQRLDLCERRRVLGMSESRSHKQSQRKNRSRKSRTRTLLGKSRCHSDDSCPTDAAIELVSTCGNLPIDGWYSEEEIITHATDHNHDLHTRNAHWISARSRTPTINPPCRF